jgi:DNA-binding transcriptional ArsR family regulator
MQPVDNRKTLPTTSKFNTVLSMYFDFSGIIVYLYFLFRYAMTMKTETAAKQLEALGNLTRLAIYRNLAEAGSEGSSVGEIKAELDIPGSTLSHHIAKLVNAGLLSQQRDSRSLVCRVNNESMDELMEFLVQNCCTEDWIIQSE